MYTHDKNNILRHYLKGKAMTATGRFSTNREYNLDNLLDTVQVFDVEKMHAVIRAYSSKNNLHRNHQRYLDYIGDSAGYLALATVPAAILDKLDTLQLQFPNFADVIAYYREQMALAQVVDKSIFAANPYSLLDRQGLAKPRFAMRCQKQSPRILN